MPRDEQLAERLREVMASLPGASEQRMFGGVAFLVNGNMAISASGQGGLLVHVDPDEGRRLKGTEHVRAFVMRNREMDGWLHVDAEAVRDGQCLQQWVDRGVARARSLPAKAAASRRNAPPASRRAR